MIFIYSEEIMNLFLLNDRTNDQDKLVINQFTNDCIRSVRSEGISNINIQFQPIASIRKWTRDYITTLEDKSIKRNNTICYEYLMRLD